MKCLVCGEEVPGNHEQFYTLNGSICMGCESVEIDVYHVTLPGELNNGYHDVNIKDFPDMLKECDYGDGYAIVKEKMKAVKYHNLLEFTGF